MSPRKPHRRQALPLSQRGAAIVLIVIALAAILMMSALALDGGHMLVNKTRLQNAVDAAALSGAKTLQEQLGAADAEFNARQDALQALLLNAAASGNAELADAIDNAVGNFAVVEFSDSIYGLFSYPGPANARYVRVTVPDFPLTGFFWGFVQAMSDGGDMDKAVAAVATAGPSPTANPCDIAPLMVCGDPNQYDPENGVFWGYRFGEVVVLKRGAGDTSCVGPGNFQVIRLDGPGANIVRAAACGGINHCSMVGDTVETQPGNLTGPLAQGLNTRLNIYNGPVDRAECLPDKVVSFSTPNMTYNDTASPPRVEFRGRPVMSNNGNLYTSSEQLLDYNDWLDSVAGCPSGCVSNGVFERRMLKVVVGQSSGQANGQSPIPVLGFGCFFLLQSVNQQGNTSQIYGQFVRECEGDGVPGPNPVDDVGPQIIQLYKTYINGIAIPSVDS
ncbi:Tad domain-containing protein [Pseudomonas sp. CAU 1711]|uniref:TadE/TadG family type IV pilus assembly protein n=1 Tax=Pseudomonas sp. CAU 1711 TaxID=3140356 RepID=UPI003261BFA0